MIKNFNPRQPAYEIHSASPMYVLYIYTCYIIYIVLVISVLSVTTPSCYNLLRPVTCYKIINITKNK